MTSVCRLQFYNFAKSKDGRRGINDNALVALSKHNIREKISYVMEIKKKQAKHIKTDKSKNNICYKQLDYLEIDKIKQQKKETKAKSNAVGAFQMVFDFTEKVENFDSEAHKELLLNYLDEIGMLDRFELLEVVLHIDEEKNKPHFHVLFSGFDKINQKFAVNDFFSPKGEKKVLTDIDENIIYKKFKNGKHRGEYELDKNGQKIPRLEAYRRNGAQWLQDTYSEYLQNNNYVYSNKKEFSSLLQFPNGIWRKFSTETKESIYYFRELENLFHQTKKEDPHDKSLQDIKDEMTLGVMDILEIAREIQENQYKDKQEKNLSPKL